MSNALLLASAALLLAHPDDRSVQLNPGGSQGNLCLGGAIGRYVGAGQIQNSGAGGMFSLTLDLSGIPSPTGPITAVAGDTFNFQAWHRDANPGPTSNFTDAASVRLQ